MPNFKISIVNQRFETHNEHDLPTIELARAEAINGALQIGLEEVDEANPLFGAVVSVAHEGQRRARFLVSIAVSALR